jgi:Holliday junction resolvasome RuvABC ATP-dependent DNA helicase subunit
VAFDSTFIEVTTDIEDILENLRDRFGGTMA